MIDREYIEARLTKIRRAERQIRKHIAAPPPPPEPSPTTVFGMAADTGRLIEERFDEPAGGWRKFNRGFPEHITFSSAHAFMVDYPQAMMYDSIKVHGNDLRELSALDSPQWNRLFDLLESVKVTHPNVAYRIAVDHEPERDGDFAQGRWDSDDWIAAQRTAADMVEHLNDEYPDTEPMGLFTCHVPWTVVNKNRWVYVTAACELSTNRPHVEVGFDPYITTGSFTQGPLDQIFEIMSELGYDWKEHGASVNEFGFDGFTDDERARLIVEWGTLGVQENLLSMLYFYVSHQGTDWWFTGPKSIAAYASLMPEVTQPQ